MEINYKNQRTRIFTLESKVGAWRPDPTNTYLSWKETWNADDKETDVITLKKCVNEVTPENVMDKMNMYILFS